MNKELPAWRRTSPETDTSKLFGKDALMESLKREKQQLQAEREAPAEPDPELVAQREASEQTRKREKLHDTLIDQLNAHQLILGKDDESRLKAALQYANPEELRRFYDTDSSRVEDSVIAQILERIPEDSMHTEIKEQSQEAKAEKGRDVLVNTLLNLDIRPQAAIGIVDMLGQEELIALADMPKTQVELLAGVYEDMYQNETSSQAEDAQDTRKAG